MAEVIVCAVCSRARVKRMLLCPYCGNHQAYETEKPKTKWYWIGAAIYYPCFAIILLAWVLWLSGIFGTF